MRIIGGKWKRRKLSDFDEIKKAEFLRPTSDRVRESIFNLLENSLGNNLVHASNVLDIFSGTGALGLESLSRGANKAVFIENGSFARKVLEKNIALLGANDLTKVIHQDVRKIKKTFDYSFDLIFLDPPYGKRLGEKAIDVLIKNNYLAENSIIVWEENSSISSPEALGLIDERRYGKTIVSFFRFKNK